MLSLIAVLLLLHVIISDTVFFAYFIDFVLCKCFISCEYKNLNYTQYTFFEVVFFVVLISVVILFLFSPTLLFGYLGLMGAFSFPS